MRAPGPVHLRVKECTFISGLSQLFRDLADKAGADDAEGGVGGFWLFIPKFIPELNSSQE